MKTTWIVLAAGSTALIVAACGGTSGDNDDAGFARDGEAAATRPSERSSSDESVAGAPALGSVNPYGTDDTDPLPADTTTRKIIFTATLDLTSEDVGRTFNDAASLARSNGGYVERSNYTNNAEENARRSASLTIRVPSQNFDGLLASLRGMAGATVKTEGSNSNEVTEQYTDLESRLRNLERTEQQYLTLLTDAKSIQDILTVQDRLSGVRGQIEQIQGRLKVLDDLTDFATIELSIAPVVAKAADTSSGGWKLSEVLVESWEGSLEVLRYLAAGGIVLLIAGAWLVIPVTLGVIGSRRFRRRSEGSPPLAEA